MANHRDLANELYATSLGRTSASRIWRTVVFAGAMLAAPLAGCGGSPKKTQTAPVEDKAAADQAAADQAATDQAAADKAAADKAAADQAAMAAEAEKAAADQAAADQAKKQQEENEAAINAATAAEPAAKKRPRGGGDARPKGRGFVLA